MSDRMPPREEDEAVMRTYRDLFGTKAAWGRAPIIWGFQVGPGWRPIVLRLLDDLRRAAEGDGAPVRIRQIKEKFGELRVYVRGGGQAALDAIGAAEQEASATCETCGAPGRLRRARSYLQVLCGVHAILPRDMVITVAARRSELSEVRRSREVVGVVDEWLFDYDEGSTYLGGVERTSGAPIYEPVVAVDARPVPRAYTAQGWLELGRRSEDLGQIPHFDETGLLVALGSAANAVRARLLGRAP